MTPVEKYLIRQKIALEKPEHLGGFDEGWLFEKQINLRFGKIIQIFSIDNDKINIVTSIVC